MIQTQTRSIRDYLLTGATITAIEALDLFGCFRLAARIRDIKDMDYEIAGKMIKDVITGKSYKRYRLVFI